MTYKSQCLCPGHSRTNQSQEIGEMPRVEMFYWLEQGKSFRFVSHILLLSERPVITVFLFWSILINMGFFHIRAAVFLSFHKQNKDTKGMQTLLLNSLFIGVLPRNHASMTIMPSYCYAFSTLHLRPLTNAFFLTLNHLRSVLCQILHQPLISWQTKTMPCKAVCVSRDEVTATSRPNGIYTLNHYLYELKCARGKHVSKQWMLLKKKSQKMNYLPVKQDSDFLWVL